jgi:hypothetical protein
VSGKKQGRKRSLKKIEEVKSLDRIYNWMRDFGTDLVGNQQHNHLRIKQTINESTFPILTIIEAFVVPKSKNGLFIFLSPDWKVFVD